MKSLVLTTLMMTAAGASSSTDDPVDALNGTEPSAADRTEVTIAYGAHLEVGSVNLHIAFHSLEDTATAFGQPCKLLRIEPSQIAASLPATAAYRVTLRVGANT